MGKKVINCSFILLLLISIQSSYAFTSSYSFELLGFMSIDQGRTSGHEEITRQALRKTKHLLIENRSKVDISRGGIKLLSDLDASKRGLIGALSKNPIVKGVYCSDFPDNSKCNFDLAKFWYGSKANEIDWHNGAFTQSLHFLRDYDESTGLVSAKKACYEGRRKISGVLQNAALQWEKGNIENSLFLIGHALHILQDSFSHAHVLRENFVGKFRIKDICYYGDDKRHELQIIKKEFMACYHPTLEFNSIEETILGDSIWVRTDQQLKNTKFNFRDEDVKKCPMTTHQYIIFDDEKEDCLNGESRLARDASVKLLYLVAENFHKHRHVKYTKEELVKFDEMLTKRFFEGSPQIQGFKDRMPDGVARCEHL